MSTEKQTYFYPDGNTAKENDIVFYSEDDGSHKWHYADSIGLIVDVESVLKLKAFVITMDDTLTFESYEEPKNNMISLEHCQNTYRKDGVLTDFKKIGEYPKDKHMLTAEYANNNYSIKK